MTTIAWPTGIFPRSFSLRLATVQRVFSSPFGGSEQAVDLLNDRWMASMELPANTHANIAAVEAFIASLRGQTNTVALYHFARTVPRGTLASATYSATSQGASSINLSGTGTLKQGDLFSAGGQLLQVASDTTLAGATAVPVVNRLRTALTSGSIVVTQPTANFRLISQSTVQYLPNFFSATVSLDFAEAI